MKSSLILSMIALSILTLSSCNQDGAILISIDSKTDTSTILDNSNDSNPNSEENLEQNEGNNPSDIIPPIIDLPEQPIEPINPVDTNTQIDTVSTQTQTQTQIPETDTTITQTEITVDTQTDVTNTDQSIDLNPQPPVDSINEAKLAQGEKLWNQYNCINCHGDIGDGQPFGKSVKNSLVNNRFAVITEITMPVSNPDNCDLECANTIEYWLAYQLDIPLEKNDEEDNSDINTQTETETQTQTQTQTDSTEDTNTDTNTENTITSIGEKLWNEQSCGNCHGDIGDGLPSGISIVDSILKNKFIEDTNQTMPYGNPSLCDNQCASDIQSWLKIVLDISDEDDIISIELDDNEKMLVTQPILLNRLYKISVNLLGEIPAQNWIDQVNRNEQAGLNNAIDEILEDPKFLDRVANIYKSILHTGSNKPNAGYVRNYPGGNRDWHSDYDGDKMKFLRNSAWNAITDEPLNLIKHVIENNKPFGEILTADYVLMNPFSAISYNKSDDVSFTEIDDPEYSSHPYDPNQYKVVSVDEFPHAGVLTSANFMNMYPTTATNVNRHRAYKVFELFLDTDILEIGGSRITTEDIAVDNPTLNNDACTSCHNIMDPVSSSFRHWQRGSDYRDQWENAQWTQDGILLPGFNAKEMPSNEVSSLQWVANEIANDPRFALSTIKRVFPEFTGYPILARPNFNDDELTHQRYEYQQSWFEQTAYLFIENDLNFKWLTKYIVSSDYFNGEAFTGGNQRLLPADILLNKLEASLGSKSFTSDTSMINSDVYTGDHPTGVMSIIHQYVASEMSCRSVAIDFTFPKSDRLLFPDIDLDQILFNDGQINEQAKLQVSNTIQNLMWRLWGQMVELDNQTLIDLVDVYFLFAQISDDAGNNISTSNCRPDDSDNNQIKVDSDYQLRAWVAILNLMIDHNNFMYE